jgi:hypothetical protein
MLPALKLLVSVGEASEKSAHAKLAAASAPKTTPSATATMVVHRRGEWARAMVR